jgi:hypothetical protein
LRRNVKPMMAAVLAAVLLPAGLLALDAPANGASVCPAIGQDTDCGVIITITDAGAQVAATGQGPYDGVDDTLVGVVNNGKLPINSLILSSGTNIFGFDGDGIDTYGAPGNASDTTGYGGPDAYFTNINAAQTSGTVNFLTPIPVGGSTYFGLENSIANAVSCQDAINGSVPPPTVNGPQISATFTPKQGLTIQQAAQLCGFTNFDWVQKITALNDPSPYIARNIGGAFNPKVAGPVRLTSKDVPFNDPPQGGGYAYEPNPDFSYPFYYNVTTELPGQQAGGTTMTFSDLPRNPCLPGGAGVKTATCAFGEDPPGSHESFVTHLAGVTSDGSATDLGIGFTWSSNYNNINGGVSAKSLAPGTGTGTGTGGVTVTSVQPDTTYQYNGVTVTGLNGGTAGPSDSMLVYSGAQALPDGGWSTLSAQLSTIDATPISGRAVTLTLGSGDTEQRCTGYSDASGTATCRIPVAQPLGPEIVTATFAGDSSFGPSTTSYSVIVFAYTRGGTYVIGDKSAGDLLPGPTVTFWSSKWSQQNQLSGGPAPATFDGLSNSVAPLSCQDLHPWAGLASTGRYNGPPVHVPAYTAVIVTSKVVGDYFVAVGNSADIVIVAANASTPGSGTIVADLC